MKHLVFTFLAACLERLFAGISAGAARLALLAALAAGGSSAFAATVYVNAAATAPGTGTSWATAYTDLHSALAGRSSGDQIWVAQGTYATTSQTDTFQLVTGVAVYGGFVGTETTLAQRNLFPELTILNGAYAGGNSYHVVTGADNSSIDGFTIENGVASVSSYPNGYGGGLWTYGAGTSVAHCVFLNNTATWAGGAVMCGEGATASAFTDCAFSGNVGGGTRLGGGAVVAFSTLPNFINCVFTNNSSNSVGGIGGGAMFLYGTTSGSLVNCTFSGNIAAASQTGSAIYFYGSACTLSTTNCAFWGNTAATSITAGGGATATITSNNCMFQEASLSTGVSLSSTGSAANLMGVNPLFFNAASPAGTDGNFGTRDDGLQLVVGSPAIGAGTATGAPATDLLGLPRPSATGTGYDIGAYQYQPVIYASPTGTGNGGSWATAATLKNALAGYQIGNGQQIWAAAGTYKTLSQGDTFQLKTGMPLYGGFAGTETQLAQRSWTANQTTLSANTVGAPSYHVVNGANNAILDGFVVSGGNAPTAWSGGYPNDYGGGLFALNFTMTVSHCTFMNNSSNVGGGAVAIGSGTAQSVFTDCAFYQNTTNGVGQGTAGNGFGGGAVIIFGNGSVASSASFINCVFANNNDLAAEGVGGGAVYLNSAPGAIFTNCTFSGNSATASDTGGAIALYNNTTSLTLINDVFWGNTAASAYSVTSSVAATITANNNMFQEATSLAANLTISGGLNKFGINPNFVLAGNPAGPDGVFGTSDDGLALAAGSVGIDSGTATGAPSTDIILTPRPLGAGYDIGAYEYIPPVLYVTTGGSGAGLSFAVPASLSNALAVAVPGEQIWVEQGTYIPPGGATGTFTLPTGVAVYGGFNGSEGTLAARNPGLNPTILSGANVCYHVVTGANGATLSGFVIKGGNALYSAYDTQGGGGILCEGTSPTVFFCVFTGNAAAYGGGAAWIRDGATPIFRNCVFTQNTADVGGAIECEFNASPSLINCTFTANTGSAGGAIETYQLSNPVLKNCILWGDNTSTPEYYNNGGTPVITYSDIYGGSPVSGAGNLSVDPLFVNATSPVGADSLWMTYDDGLMLSSASPCLSAGTLSGAADDILRSIRPLGPVPTACAIGAYESPTITVSPATQSASKGSTTTVPPVSAVPATVTLTRNGQLTLPMTVTFQLGGTATASDYAAVPAATATFLAGNATTTVAIDPVTTSVAGPSVTVVLAMTTALNAYEFSAANTDTITIANPNIPGVVLLPQGPFAHSPDPTNALLTSTIQPGVGAAVTSTFKVKLNSQPTQSVTINLASSNLLEGTVSPTTLTFTPTGATAWNIAQTVTLTGVNDPIDHGNGDQAYTIQTSGASSQDPIYNRITSFSSLPAAQSLFNTSLPYVAQAALPANNWVVKETIGGVSSLVGPANFTVTPSTLNASLAAITLTTAAPAGATVTIQYLSEISSPSGSLIYDTPFPFALFQGNDWVVSVNGAVQDPSVSATAYTVQNDGSGNAEVVFTHAPAFPVLIQADVVAAENTDNYHKGFNIVPAGTLSLIEGKTSATYTVALNSQPSSGTVSLNLSGQNLANFTTYLTSYPGNFTVPTNVSTNVNTLTFTSGNWNTPQAVTVSAAHDFIIETPAAPNAPYPGQVSQAVSTTCPEYVGQTAAAVPLQITDIDTAGVVLSPQTITTSESDTGASAQAVTVTLNSLPSAPVTLTITCVDPVAFDPSGAADNDGGILDGPGTVTASNPHIGSSGPSLNFTYAVTLPATTYTNWQSGQTISLQGLRGTAGVSQSPNTAYTLNLAASATSDAAYSALPAVVLANCTNKDIDTAGVIISPPQLTVTRGGTPGKTFSVQLADALTSGSYVVLTFSDASGLLDISPSTVLFNTGSNPYNVPVTVTVTAPNNFVVEPQKQGTLITCVVTSDATGGAEPYNNIPVTPITVTVLDNGTAGIALTPTAGLVTSESGSSANFQVSLLSRPASSVDPVVDTPVTVTLASSNLGAGILAQEFYSSATAASAITFPAGTDLGSVAANMLVHIGGLGANSGSLTQVTAVNAAGETVSVAPALKAYSGLEVIDILPALKVPLASSDGATTVLTFGGSPDLSSVFEGQSVLLTDTGGTPLCTATVSYVYRPGFQVTLKGVLLVGGSQTVTAIPAGSSQKAWFSTGSMALTWPAGSWTEDRTVTVIGVHNQQVNGNVGYTVTASAASADPHYATSQSVAVLATDFDSTLAYQIFTGANWTAKQNGITLSPFTITNNGGNAHLVLATGVDPTAGDVVLNYVPSAGANQTIGMQATSFGSTIPYSATDTWSAKQGASILTIAAITNQGGNAYVTLAAGVDPAAGPVTITDSTTTASQTATLLFTDFDSAIPYVAYDGSNWAASQGATALGGITISDEQGYAHLTLATGVPASGGPVTLTYLPMVSLTNLDIDTAGYRITPPAITTIGFGAPASTTFTVTLTSEPIADVLVPVQSSNTGKGELDALTPSPLLFTQQTPNIVGGVALGWDQPHAVTIDAVLSLIADGTVPFTVDLQPASTTDGNYSAVAPPPGVNLATTDPNAAGIIVTNASSLPLTFPLVTNAQTPALATQTFYLSLTSQPLGQVTVNLASSNILKGTVSPASVVFTSTAYTLIPVTVSAVGNSIVQGPVNYQITLQAQSTTDANYAVLSPSPVAMQGQDNNRVGLVISDPASGHVYDFLTGTPPDPALQTTDLGGTAQFQVALNSQPAQPVTIVLASTDATQGSVLPATLVFDPSNWSVAQQVTVTGANSSNNDLGGLYGITLTVSSPDPFYNEPVPGSPPLYEGPLQATTTLPWPANPPTLDVAVPMSNVAQNKVPTLDPITSITVNENQAVLPTIPLTGITTGQAAETNTLVVTVTGNDNTGLITSVTPTYTSPSTTGSLSFTLQPNQFGVANITVTVTSPAIAGIGGPKSISQTFAITVNFVNQPPSFTAGAAQNLTETAGAQPITVLGWATNISVGPPNQFQETLTFGCTNSNNALFSVPPAIDPATGDLTYTIAPASFGTANVTVVLTNSGGTANGGNNASPPAVFPITVAFVNQPPTFTVPAPNLAINEGAPAQSIPGFVTGITPGPANESAQTVSFALVNDNNALFTVQPALSSAGTLTFTPLATARGYTTVTVTESDSLGATTIQTFTITINPVNFPPVVAISPAAGREVAIGATQVITAAFLSANEVDAPAIDPTLTFTVQLVPGNGTLSDNGVALVVGSTFLQSEITAGNITYTHNGGTSASDGFAFTVTNSPIPAGSVLASPPLPATTLPAATTALQVFSIIIDRTNPVVALLPSSALAFADQGAPELMAPLSTVSDSNVTPPVGDAAFTSTTGLSGTIAASFASGDNGADALGIDTSGAFSVVGTQVLFNPGGGPLPFGTLSQTLDLNGGHILTVTGLTTIADVPTVQAFIRSLTYQNTAISPSDPYANPNTSRVVQVQAWDVNSDPSSLGPIAQRTIVVTSAPHPLVFATPTSYVTNENVALPGVVSVTDVDLGQTVTYSVTGSTLGSAVINPATGAFTFTPTAGVTGSGSFTVHATDGHTEFLDQTVTVVITGVQLLPAGPLTFIDQGSPEFIAPTSTVVDPAGFAGGQIQASFSAGGTINDVISINTAGAFTVVGTTVKYNPGGGPVAFGNLSTTQGASGTILTVTGLTVVATTPVVAAFISNLDYQDTAVSPSNPYTASTTSRTFQVVVTDALAVASTPAQLTINVDSVPHAPTFTSPTSYVTNENVPLSGTVSATDVDLGQTLTYSITGNTLGMAVINAASGAFTFTPTAGLTGSGSFTVQASDGHGNATSQVITVIITGVQLLPAGPLTFIDLGSPEFIAPTSTVVDPAGFAGGQIQASFSAGGTINDVISINTAGAFTVVGTTVKYNPGGGPVAFGNLSTTQGASGTILTVTGLTVVATTPVVAAFISNLDYQNTAASPSNPYTTPSTSHVVQVVVTDALAVASTPALLTINVTSVQHAPTFTSPTQYVTAKNTPLAGQVVAVDIDQGQTLTYSVIGSPALGGVVIDPATGAFTFTPTANITGSGGFTVQATDGHSETISQAIAVDITGVQLRPAGPLTFVDQGAPEFIAPTSTVVDPAGFAGGQIQASFTVGGTINDVISINTTGAFTLQGLQVMYNPGGGPALLGSLATTQGASGTVLTVTGLTTLATTPVVAAFISDLDYQNTAVSPSDPYANPVTSRTIQVLVTDAGAPATVSSALLSVNVTSQPHLPVFTSPTNYTTAENVPLMGQVVATEVDTGQTLTYSVIGSPILGGVVINPANGVFTFTPQANTTGTGSFTVQATDGHSETTSEVISVFMPGVVLLPAGPLSYIDQGPPEFIAPTSTVTDPAGFAGGQIVASFSAGGTINDVISIGTTGLFTLNGTNVLYDTGVGSPQQFGIVSFTQGNAGTILTVANLTALATTPVVTAFISDLQFQNVAVSPSDPYANPVTSCTVQVVVTDAINSVSSPAQRTITITSVPHLPTFSAPTQFTTPENVALSAQVTAVDVDLGQTLTYSVIGSPSLGTVTAFNTATGAFTFTPQANTTGIGGFTVQVTDNVSETTSLPISVFISGVVLRPAGPLAFQDQGPPEFIAPTSTVTDVPGFAGGQISVSFSTGGTISDVISVNTTGQFSLSPGGGTVLYDPGTGAAAFGTLAATQGAAGTVMTVTNLTGLATTTAVQAFISNLDFQNIAVSPSDPYANPVTSRTVQVVVTDAAANVSSPALLSINVTSVPHTPTFTSPTTYVTAENIPLSGQVVAVDVDLGQTLTYAVVGTPTLGTVVINPLSGAFTFTPVANTLGNGSFTVQVSDGNGGTATQVINAIISNDNPLEPFVTSNPPLETQQGDTVIYNVVGYSPGTAAPTFTVVGLAAGTYTLTVSGQTATLTLLSTATATAGYVTFGILITDTINNLSGFQPVTLLVDPTPAAGG